MLKGRFINSNGLSDDRKPIHFRRNGHEIHVIGHIYNVPETHLAETILNEYEAKGYSYFATLDGAFTIIIYAPDKTVLVRDHHGIHSQVYYTNELFSSSLYDLIQEPGVDRTPNYPSLALFLTAGHIKAPHTSFAHIHKVEAGHLLEYRPTQGVELINLFPFEALQRNINEHTSLEEYAESFYHLHQKAIQSRIAGNEKVGLFLTGGFDSGGNLIALRDVYGGDIDTYSIGFKGESISELPQARLMSDTFGTTHREYEIDGSEIEKLPELIRHLGDPFAECGMMINYSVFHLVGKDYPGVLLGGEGNDHYFSTANRQMAMNFLMNRFGLIKPLSLLKSMLDHELFDRDGLLFRAQFHLTTSLDILQGEIFGFPRYQVSGLLRNRSHLLPFVPIKPDYSSYENLYMQHIYRTDIEKGINRVIAFKSSKVAEMYNNHVAYPFIGLDLFHFMNNLPASFKCKGDSLLAIARGRGVPKYLHKYIYAPKMPEQIAQKGKQGGFVPMSIFFKDDTRRRRMSDLILESGICREFLQRSKVEQFLANFDRETKEPVKWFWYRQIRCNQFFNLLSLAIWWDEFVERRGNR